MFQNCTFKRKSNFKAESETLVKSNQKEEAILIHFELKDFHKTFSIKFIKVI